jgi:glycerol-3-phosphate acyltransferase PlsY
MIALQIAGLVVLGYLIGAIPFGVVVGKLTRGIDVREHGSGGMGMTNVMRTVGRKAGALVFLADLLKGAGAVALAWPILGSSSDMLIWGHVAGGAAAVIGHSWPVYIRFKGGRGIATGFGALLVISWQVALIALAVFILVVGITRYVSLGSILGALTMLVAMIPFVVYDLEHYAYTVFAAVIAAIVIFRHRGNIQRLRLGTESKIGQKVKTS